ncbi:MAG: HIT family protein [Burkholderiaceae bacterium]|nr:MAG: HIT family protein [Burkholderiaceae bacterium]TAM04340.1 MAG: HIT family protein [Pusillimonas sp.]
MAYDTNNIFAKILRGEASCISVYEDDKTLAFMDLMPQAEGHVLIVPKEAAENLLDLSEAGAQACILTTRRIALAVKKALGVEGIHVAQLNGAAAGQTVPHCHFHVIPHATGTVLRMHAAVRAPDDELKVLAQRIKACLA